MTYNDLDLIGNIVRNDTTLVNYSYLSDGTKLSALDGSGAGLVYRGPFVYRKSSGGNAGSFLAIPYLFSFFQISIHNRRNHNSGNG